MHDVFWDSVRPPSTYCVPVQAGVIALAVCRGLGVPPQCKSHRPRSTSIFHALHVLVSC